MALIATWEAPLEPAEPDAAVAEDAVAEDPLAVVPVDEDSVGVDSVEPTAAVDPAVLLVVAVVESVVPLDVMFMLLPMPDIVPVVSAAPEEAVDATADVVAVVVAAAAEDAVDAAVEVWPLTAATARAAMTRTWNTFMIVEVEGSGGGLDT